MKELFIASLLAALSASTASAQVPSIMGIWLVESGKAHVQIAPCADPGRGPVCGTIVALINPKGADGKPVEPAIANDFRNPDTNLRDRKVIGQVMSYDFKKASEPNTFEGGTIYSAETGKSFKANISLQADGTLRLRGYIGTPMFGETQIWTRVR
ncbi:MAG: DUF2147 domain-containing protein [Alphaproteobacteria bacterium]|nr:DUF2147 domain-containing protein [Alphaproteobacteria bacterium]